MNHYLNKDFTYWNPKLTTPPMLYILNCIFALPLIRIGFSVLIACRLINTYK